ncbi:MAG: hypothetical protein EHM43_05010 [Ignavibacteriae bacterium]|nr:MAG: hypothetical protein EHM43_05010 [Ignavibacteriota bacterium]
MKTLNLFVGIAIAAMLLVSCEEGPTSADPGQEMDILYDSGILEGLKFTKSADLIYSGDGLRITAIPCLSDTLTSSGSHFYAQQKASFNQEPVFTIKFKGGVPTATGSYTWDEADVSLGGFAFTATFTSGVEVNNPDNGVTYYPVSGTTVITRLDKDGNGNITGIGGYFNGKLRSIWPANFTPSGSQPFPPGFDPQSPSLAGDNLTAQSGVFYSRSPSNVRPSTSGN